MRHPYIEQASKAAIDRFGTGTHGVRLLGGTLDIHLELEQKIAQFFHRDDAITYSSGYVTNLATISTLIGKGDWIISDKWNHASIVDGCALARGKFVRFRHNDMKDLERRLQQAPADAGKLVIADAVFSTFLETRRGLHVISDYSLLIFKLTLLELAQYKIACC